MQSALGFPPDLAARLHGWARGRDEAPVAPRPPPKTLSVQMSLTPEPLPMHPSTIGQQAVAGGSCGERCRIQNSAELARHVSLAVWLWQEDRLGTAMLQTS